MTGPSFRRGDDTVLLFDVAASDGGTLPDLSTLTAIAFAMSRRLGAPTLISKSLDDGIETSGTEIAVTLSSADTADLRPGGYYIEVQCTGPGGDVATLTLDTDRVLVLADQIGNAS